MIQNQNEFFLFRWFKRMFLGKKPELSLVEEEQLQSPGRVVIKNFFSKPLNRISVFVFILIFLIVFIGPNYLVLDLSYQDNTQAHVAPGFNMMNVPEKLAQNVLKISSGPSYACGIDKDGNAYVWGYTKISETINLNQIPDEVKQAKLVDISAAYDHIVALSDKGELFVWGNDRLGQKQTPRELNELVARNENPHIVSLESGNQFSIAVTADGNIYPWGNANLNDIKVRKAVKGQVQKATCNINTYLVLTKEGAVQYSGFQQNAYSTIPSGLDQGVVDIASSAFINAALKADGSLVFWGNITKGENLVPAHQGKIVSISGGRNHYSALTDQGEILSWGDNRFGQSSVPELHKGESVVKYFTGFYQNYAVTSENRLLSWGLRGYLLGTDHLGRDILTRIVNGGRTTMTVGAVSVIISLIIGVFVGGISGYFGGKIDILLMRVAEVVGGLPFLPFALILSAIIGTRISVEQRMYLIMVVLGVLSWPGLARIVRAQIFSQREMEFVTAAQAMGVKEGAIVFKHIIPNVISIIIVDATLSFATSMLTESTLSFLGFGISPPMPTWGNMLTGANDSIVIQQFWWRWVFPALIFSICTICINIIGDGLRDAIDPKSNER